MRLSSIARIVSIGFAGFFATAAFAANKGHFHVQAPVTVAGQSLPAGDYTVQWKDSGDIDPVLKIVDDKRVIIGKNVEVIAHAKIVLLDRTPDSDAIVVKADDGVRRLYQIRFAGRKTALEIIDDAPVSADAPKAN